MKKYLTTPFIVLLCVSVFAQKRAPIDTSKFVFVDGGSFDMGTSLTIEAHEGPQHKVSVSSFYLAKTEVTFADFDKFTSETKRDTVPSGGWGRGKMPVFMVSWRDACAYCNWKSEKDHLSKSYLIKDNDVSWLDTAKGYRLPTEAEWEFAAHGGNKTQGFTYSGSNKVDEVGWNKTNSEGRSKPVAQKMTNELGLYDMTGNLWEWVWDIYDWNYYVTSPPDNPKGSAQGPYRVMRGGAWYNDDNHSRIVTRQNHDPGFRQNSVGFRIARNYIPEKKTK